MTSKKILILVHPGSACGSADFNIGSFNAQAARSRLVDELDQLSGGLLVVDGDLSDELSSCPQFNEAILGALKNAEEYEELSLRILGQDPDHVAIVGAFVEKLGKCARDIEFTVSGAWYHPEDGEGCVGAVVNELTRLGYKARVSDDAVQFTPEEEGNND